MSKSFIFIPNSSKTKIEFGLEFDDLHNLSGFIVFLEND